MLQFLERQRILSPVARIRFPDAVVIEDRGLQAVPPSTDEERAASDAFIRALGAWKRYDAAPERPHPLDEPPPTAWAALLTHPSETPFVPWEEMRTNIRPAAESPLYVETGVRTYYHGWQVLLLADAVEMGVRLVFDTRDAELRRLAVHDHRDIPDDVSFGYVPFDAPRGLRDGETWSSFFDAADRFATVLERASNALAARHPDGAELSEAEQQSLRTLESRSAKAISPFAGDALRWISFIRYAGGRWIDWQRRGSREIANAYKQHIGHACRLIMTARELTFAELAVEVGSAGLGGGNTLDRIFPDLQLAARQTAERSLTAAVVSLAPKPPDISADLELTAADVSELLDWLEFKDQWKLHLHIEALLQRQSSRDTLDRAAFAKEVEQMGATFEHLVTQMLEDVGETAPPTLMPKLQRLCSGLPALGDALTTYRALTSTKKNATRDHRVREIDRLVLPPDRAVARVLLKATLDRNVGTHVAMQAWPEKELHKAIRTQLTAILFCRKVLTSGYLPVSTPSPVTPTALEQVRSWLAKWIKALAKLIEP